MRSTFKVLFYLKRNKDKDQKVVPVMGRITVNGSIAQFSAKLSVPEMLWEVSGGRAKGRSLEADRINRHLDNIRTQIGKHYQDICDRESYVTAEKVKNAYLGFGEKYRLLLEAFEKFTGDLKKRVGIDRCHGTWNRYYKSIDHLRTFMRKEYNVSDMPLAELEQSFIEQYHVYLKSDLGLKPTTVSGYLKCLKYVVKIAFNNGWMPRNPFSLYQYTAPNPERSFLTEDELRRMMTTELRYKRQDYNRDMFLFSCFTGICYADMASLTYDRIEQDAQGEWWISGNRQKTETRYVVKLLPYALFIHAERVLQTSYVREPLRVSFTQDKFELAALDRARVDFTIEQDDYDGTYTVQVEGTPTLFRNLTDDIGPVTGYTVAGNGTYPLRIRPEAVGENPYRITVTDEKGNSAFFDSFVTGIKTVSCFTCSFSKISGGIEVVAEGTYPVMNDLTITLNPTVTVVLRGGATKTLTCTMNVKIEADRMRGRASATLDLGTGYTDYSVTDYEATFSRTASENGMVEYAVQ